MRHRKHTFRVGRTPAHRKALLRNLARSVIREGRIVTTLAKAREARRLVEKLITLGKDGSLHARRRAISLLGDADTVHFLFEHVVEDFSDRNGGYTRVLHLGRRRGDAAEMAILELLEAPSGADEAEEADDMKPAVETASSEDAAKAEEETTEPEAAGAEESDQ